MKILFSLAFMSHTLNDGRVQGSSGYTVHETDTWSLDSADGVDTCASSETTGAQEDFRPEGRLKLGLAEKQGKDKPQSGTERGPDGMSHKGEGWNLQCLVRSLD